MHQNSRAIVLHTVKYSETSIITKLYTENNGLVTFIVKGVRTVKGKSKAALFQPLSILDISYAHRQNKNLQFIKEYRLAHTYHSIPFDSAKSAVGMFLLEVINKALKEYEPDTEMFEFIQHALEWLDTEPLNPDFHLLFLIHFSRFLGFVPNNNYTADCNCFNLTEGIFTKKYDTQFTVLTETESRYIYELLESNLFQKKNVHTHLADRKRTLKNLIQYYSFHLENFQLKSPEVLEVVMS